VTIEARTHAHTQTYSYIHTTQHFKHQYILPASGHWLCHFIGSQFTSKPITTNTFTSFSKMSDQFDKLLSNISSPLLSQTLYMYGHHKYQMHIIPTKVI